MTATRTVVTEDMSVRDLHGEREEGVIQTATERDINPHVGTEVAAAHLIMEDLPAAL